jgi:hypothetical protein
VGLLSAEEQDRETKLEPMDVEAGPQETSSRGQNLDRHFSSKQQLFTHCQQRNKTDKLFLSLHVLHTRRFFRFFLVLEEHPPFSLRQCLYLRIPAPLS